MKNLILLIFAVVGVRIAPAAITPSEAPEGPKEADGHMAVEHRASVPLPATPQIEVSLVDGSRLVGTTTLKKVMLKSTTMGELSVPLQRIASIRFSKNHEFVTVTLANDDRIEEAVLGDTTLPLTTSFGQVMVPLDKATQIQMRASGGAAAEWDLLPLPADPSWEGDMGGPPMLAGDELVLRGWSARSKQTYRQPWVVECELWLDEQRANDGCVWISFAPADLPREKLNRQSVLTVTVGYGARGVKVDGCGHTDERISRDDFTVAARRTYRVRIVLLNAKLRVTVDDQVYEADKVTLPDEDYQLYIRGWQPANTWRLRNTTVRCSADQTTHGTRRPLQEGSEGRLQRVKEQRKK